MNIEFDRLLDTSGLLCPEPVMMLHKAVRESVNHTVLKVVATDPSTVRDIPKFCHFLGHELLDQSEVDSNYEYFIKVIAK
jgi:tRNA 2-thiouridine synthesizing protein A